MRVCATVPLAWVSLLQLVDASTSPRQSGWTIGQTVQTSSGPVTGQAAPNASDVSEYLGIPFAQPPVGNLRFQPPVRFNGTRPINATTFGFSCVSTSVNGEDGGGFDPSLISKFGVPASAASLLSEFGSTTNQSEDCLTVNVWTKPQVGESKKAVLVWIYGGAYVTGSSAIPWYAGQHFADQEDIVLVSFNYRLSIFGFPGNPSAAANLGLLDQRLAVEWVRDNIAGFGGDPERIILFGQSAGGGGVDIYSYAWTRDPIVKGFIPMSGTVMGITAQTKAKANEAWFNVTNILGCGNSASNPTFILQCMVGKTALEIAKAAPLNSVSNSDQSLPYSPSVDDVVVFADYTKRKPISAPILIGNTDNEAGLFLLTAPDLPLNLVPYINQVAFNCPSAARAALSVAHGIPTWRYRYMGIFPNMVITTTPPSGAWHGADLAPLFDTVPQDVLASTTEQIAISKYMRGAWAAFAKDPVKGLTTYDGGWPQYSPNTTSLIRVGFNNQTGTNAVLGSAYDTTCLALSPVPGGNGTNGGANPTGGGGAQPTPSSPTTVSPNGTSQFGLSGCAIVFAAILSIAMLV